MAEERPQPQVDWEEVERSPAFRALLAARRRFVVPATIFFLSYYMGFILLCGYASDFMGSSIYEGLTVGYTLALTQFLMVLVLGLMYLKRADEQYDPLADRVVQAAAGLRTEPAPQAPAGAGATAAGTEVPR